MQKLLNPDPIFLDARGDPLTGTILVGSANEDPAQAPIALFWDKELTIAAAQPLQVIAGYIVNETQPAGVFFAEDDFSMRQIDVFGVTIRYSPSIYNITNQFQPIDTDLSAIAALGTTPFGRSLLALANQQALRNAIGYPEPLPKAGGTVTGDIVRDGAAKYLYNVQDSAYSGRIYYTAAGMPDPTSMPGDIWFELS